MRYIRERRAHPGPGPVPALKRQNQPIVDPTRSSSFRRRLAHRITTGGYFLLLLAGATASRAQSPSFAGDAQHSAIYPAPAQAISSIHWVTNTDLYSAGDSAHYGAPLVTVANTLILPLRTNATRFMLNAFAAATGQRKYSLATDYVPPPYNWLPVYQPVLATNNPGTRLYYPGAGGTVYYVDNPDSDTPGTPVQLCPYTSLAAYRANSSVLNNNVYVNTGLAADTKGAVFFGIRVLTNGTATVTTNTQGGFARIDADGSSRFVTAITAIAGTGSTAATTPHNAAPAISRDGATVYVAVKSLAPHTTNYLLALDSATLATKHLIPLISPVQGTPLVISSDSTASPTVGPDGDVYYGMVDGDARGYLLHFNADLTVRKTPSGFGWDNTAAIVPTNMVPGYKGPSSYLLLCKYNNYAARADGDGVNRIALLDPNATELDGHPTESKLVEMRIVRSVIGCTPDTEYLSSTYPQAVREWCVNTVAVNPATMSIFAASEDGRLYRWNLAANALTECVRLGAAFGEPYVPNAIGPDGVVYTLNGGRLMAVGGPANVAVAITSSQPELRTFVAGQSVTFSATVSNLTAGGPLPTGTVTFSDETYKGLLPVTNILAAAVPLSNGQASITTTELLAGTNYLGNHFITSSYNGDANLPATSATLVQKVHAFATTTQLGMATISAGSQLVLTATVTSPTVTTNQPSGMVSFWDGPNWIGQMPLRASGTASFTNSAPVAGNHMFLATYESDTHFAASTGVLAPPAPLLSAGPLFPSLGLQLEFSNLYGGSFTVLSSTNLLMPLSNWSVLGTASNIQPGLFQFIDAGATNLPGRFYRVRNP